MKIDTQLQILNRVNGANQIVFDYADKVKEEFKSPVACLMGIAFGGEVEGIAKLWKDCGKVYGFDTFEDLHPKHLSEIKDSFASTCMDWWYANEEYDVKHLAYDYQRGVLDDKGLDNATLIKGEVHKNSCKDIKEIHLAFMDMDMVESTRAGYSAIKDKMAKGGYLFLHDTQNIPGLTKWRDEVIKKDKSWKEIGEWGRELLVGFQKQ